MSVTLSNPYCTLTDLKNFLMIALTDTSKDDKLNSAINRASRFIDEMTEKIFYQLTQSNITISPFSAGKGWHICHSVGNNAVINYPAYLQAPYRPIISITGLTESGVLLVEGTDYSVDYENGVIFKISGGDWVNVPGQLKFTTSVLGYASNDPTVPATTIPYDVYEMCLEIASRRSGEYKKAIQYKETGELYTIHDGNIPSWVFDRLRERRLKR